MSVKVFGVVERESVVVKRRARLENIRRGGGGGGARCYYGTGRWGLVDGHLAEGQRGRVTFQGPAESSFSAASITRSSVTERAARDVWAIGGVSGG